MKHRGEHWTHEEILQLKTLYENGEKIADISLKVNHTENAVSKKIKEVYGANRRINWTDEEIEKLKELHEKGLSYKDIAKELNQTETINLYYWFKDNGTSLMSRKNRIIENYLESKPELKRTL